jgi:prevent-host-death family protein
MHTVSLEEAQTELAELVAQAAAGIPFIITKDGLPLVQVTALAAPAPKPRIGFATGEIKVPDDFNTMGAAEIAALFEGEE